MSSVWFLASPAAIFHLIAHDDRYRSIPIDTQPELCSIELMIPPVAAQILAMADSSGWEACVAKGRGDRQQDAQFFTPPAIAQCLAADFLLCTVPAILSTEAAPSNSCR